MKKKCISLLNVSAALNRDGGGYGIRFDLQESNSRLFCLSLGGRRIMLG